MKGEVEEERAKTREKVAKHRRRKKTAEEKKMEEEKQLQLIALKAVEKLRTRLDQNLGKFDKLVLNRR